MIMDETKEYKIQFSEEEVVLEVSYHNILSMLTLSSRMPEGFMDRYEEERFIEEDWNYLGWIIDKYTDKTFHELLKRDSLKDDEVVYILNITIETILGNEITTWEEFKKKTENDEFMGKNTLGIK